MPAEYVTDQICCCSSCHWVITARQSFCCLLYVCLLADHTNGRAYATVLRPSLSVCRRLW